MTLAKKWHNPSEKCRNLPKCGDQALLGLNILSLDTFFLQLTHESTLIFSTEHEYEKGQEKDRKMKHISKRSIKETKQLFERNVTLKCCLDKLF